MGSYSEGFRVQGLGLVGSHGIESLYDFIPFFPTFSPLTQGRLHVAGSLKV